MPDETAKRVVRINKQEISELPPGWTNQERGQYLRMLLHFRGIDPCRFYRVEYYPQRCCWLLTQEAGPARKPEADARAPAGKAEELFYRRITAEFRRTAIVAFAKLATLSPYSARLGGNYHLPPKPQELTLAELVKWLGGSGKGLKTICFTSEGGWRAMPSDN